MPSTRAKRLPARLSRNVLMTGMPPATAASKASATPAFSASAASRVPCSAINALLAVTTCFLCLSALSITLSATPSAPPISSTTTSISGSAAIATASSYQRAADKSTPRSRRRSRADTAATTMRRPARVAKSSAWRASSWRVPAPTVPSPATAIFRAGFTRMVRSRSSSWQQLNLDAIGRAAGIRRRRLGLNLIRRYARGPQCRGNRLGALKRGAIAGERLAAGSALHRRRGITDDLHRTRLLLVERRDALDLRAGLGADAGRRTGQLDERDRCGGDRALRRRLGRGGGWRHF